MTVKHLIPEPFEGVQASLPLPPDCLQRQNSPFSVERVRSPAMSLASKTTKVDVACTDHKAAARPIGLLRIRGGKADPIFIIHMHIYNYDLKSWSS